MSVRNNLTTPEDAHLREILDRVLDNGIVFEPATRVRMLGVDLSAAKDHVVIESLKLWRM